MIIGYQDWRDEQLWLETVRRSPQLQNSDHLSQLVRLMVLCDGTVLRGTFSGDVATFSRFANAIIKLSEAGRRLDTSPTSQPMRREPLVLKGTG